MFSGECSSPLQSLFRELKNYVAVIQAAHLQVQEGEILNAQLKRWDGLVDCEQRQLFSAERRYELFKLRCSCVDELNQTVLDDIERAAADARSEVMEHIDTKEYLEDRLRVLRRNI